jgi:hypothetical protein
MIEADVELREEKFDFAKVKSLECSTWRGEQTMMLNHFAWADWLISGLGHVLNGHPDSQ